MKPWSRFDVKVFIVGAHPEPQSFNTALRDLSVRVLRRQGHEVEVSDLYAMSFNPVASADDFADRSNPDYLVYALEQRHGYDTGTLAPDILGEIEKLLWCDLLILNFPIFWFSVPAILKGWIDRVLISGLTYGGKRFYDRGGLAGRKAMVTVTPRRPAPYVRRRRHPRPPRGHAAPPAAGHALLYRLGGASTVRRVARSLHIR